MSVALLCGWLLSTANIGDSDAFIDIGVSIDEVTKCHKVHTNDSEQQRYYKWVFISGMYQWNKYEIASILVGGMDPGFCSQSL